MTPRLLIHVEGGCIQQILADGAITVHVTDADLLSVGDSSGYHTEHHVDIVTREELTRRIAQAEAKNTVDQSAREE